MRSKKLFYLFVVLLFYVTAQSLWWLYNIYHLSVNQQGTNRGKLWMVLGEGLVFLCILFLGFWITYRFIKKEISLSNQQRNFLLSVTHELKTPIASVKLYLQTLKKRSLDEFKQKELIDKSIIESNRLNTLVENILTVTQIDEFTYQLNPVEFNLSELIQNTALKLMETNKRKIDFEFIIAPNVFIKSDQEALRIILINLIGNALKYTEKQSTITLSLFKKDGHVAFSVADEGGGIPKEEKNKVFDKFYRMGDENTRASKGTGLGLFIVKQLTTQLGGEVILKRNYPKGSIFVCTFEA